jgi:hypothetical protein
VITKPEPVPVVPLLVTESQGALEVAVHGKAPSRLSVTRNVLVSTVPPRVLAKPMPHSEGRSCRLSLSAARAAREVGSKGSPDEAALASKPPIVSEFEACSGTVASALFASAKEKAFALPCDCAGGVSGMASWPVSPTGLEAPVAAPERPEKPPVPPPSPLPPHAASARQKPTMAVNFSVMSLFPPHLSRSEPHSDACCMHGG